jgi:glucokinase
MIVLGITGGIGSGKGLATEFCRCRGAAILDADEIAREVVRETARLIGAGVANLLNIFNPDTVVLAGGVAQAGADLFDPLRAEVKRRAFKPAVDACRIVPGSLGSSAGVVGAVATFLARYPAAG